MMKENYYVGLDLGTGSLGWAVTDENYNVLREHGKDLWGVRLFESAQTAEKRRQFRGSRRRIQRRNHRIELLQEIFADAINEIDDGFFLRMKESKYVPEDKLDIEGQCPELPYALFVDKNYTDKDYHCQFPTIYHLRRYLMKTQDTPDIRLVYLASLIFKGANQLVLGDEDMLTLKKVCKFIKERADNKNVKITNWEGVKAQDLVKLYDTFTKKLLETVYSIKLDYGKLLEDNKQVFIELSDEDKCIVLYEILHLFQCNSTKSDLHLINGARCAGVLKMTSNISKCNQISIINQSPTGIFQQEIDLKRVK